ncbi:phage protease [Pseudomonas japonica]|uniref:phage protease n=1 Tax=Pseudomonas japonica TaxID=256466 RepID=UPI003A88D574
MTRLIPAGEFDAPRGAMEGTGPWFLDEALAKKIIERAARRSTDIVIDYEHQTLGGGPAPASGWIDRKSLEWRDDGMYGRVKWTRSAARAIAEDEYRYLSPVFPYDAESGAVLDLLHVGLTNNPAIDTAIPALAAARMGSGAYPTTQEDNTVDREELIKLLGLADDANDEQIAEAIKKLQADLAAKDEQIAAKTQEVAAAKAGAAPDLSKYVPRAVYDEAQKQVAALSANGSAAELDKLIDEGLKDGRIAGKATADWLKSQGLAACKAHLEGAPSIAALTASQTRSRAPEGKGGKDKLTDADLAVCRSLGITPEAYRKANPVEA